MAGKRKAKASKAKQDDLAKPSKWRLQHGGFSQPIREADPETGSPVQHRRAVDTLGLMLANGNITPQMHEAGCIFRTLFRSASLDGIVTSQLIRVPALQFGENLAFAAARQIGARRGAGHEEPGKADRCRHGLDLSFGRMNRREREG